jgi:hypothetical protein
LPGLGMPTELVKHYFCECLWGCFWKRVAFELLTQIINITLTNVGRHHSIHSGLGLSKKWRKSNPFSPFELRQPSTPIFEQWHSCPQASDSDSD